MNLFMDKDHQQEFKELLRIIENALVLPLSNAVCVRGFFNHEMHQNLPP
jgi:hypothetical protein